VSLRTFDGETAQQLGDVRRLYDTMKRHRALVMEIVRPTILAIIAGLLILVVLPAALGAQAGTIN
jgi:hypothetical protein